MAPLDIVLFIIERYHNTHSKNNGPYDTQTNIGNVYLSHQNKHTLPNNVFPE